MIEYILDPDNGKIGDIKTLFREYVSWIDVDLCFQGFEEELATLPGKYSPPSGCLILAHEKGMPAGCVALRKIQGDNVCEMKRLFVRESFRGRGAGRELVTLIIDAARRIGYKKMVLDTLESMQGARHLYSAAGFEVCSPYYHNPLDGAIYMQLILDPGDTRY